MNRLPPRPSESAQENRLPDATRQAGRWNLPPASPINPLNIGATSTNSFHCCLRDRGEQFRNWFAEREDWHRAILQVSQDMILVDAQVPVNAGP